VYSVRKKKKKNWLLQISRKFAFGTATLRYDGNPFALIVDNWDGDIAQLTIRGWNMKTFFIWRFTPPMSGSFGRDDCKQWYHTDVATDGLRAIRNSVPDNLPFNHPLVECNRFQATRAKLIQDVNTPWEERVSRGFYRHDTTSLSKAPVKPEMFEGSLSTPFTGSAKQASQWLLNDQPGCYNDCSYPLVCMDTGSCKCVQANCMMDSALWHDFVGGPSATVTATPASQWTTTDLVKAVQAQAIEDILLPGARDIFRTRQTLWKPIHVAGVETGMNPKIIEATNDMRCIHVIEEKDRDVGSFSADWVLFNALHEIFPAEQKIRPVVTNASMATTTVPLVAVPYYQGCYRNALHMSNEHVTDRLRDVESDMRRLYGHINDVGDGALWIMTHDFGGCVRSYWFQNCFYSGSRGRDNQPDFFAHAVVVQSMGDWNTGCIIPSKDIVIPSRSIMSPQLIPR
jgi:hypothetical protein